jgi:hypothetical protein
VDVVLRIGPVGLLEADYRYVGHFVDRWISVSITRPGIEHVVVIYAFVVNHPSSPGS